MGTATMADEEPSDSPGEREPPLEACWTIVLANIGLVYKIVNERCMYQQDRSDLVQEGLLGLLEAARRFEPSHGAAFTTYAYPWILNRVMKVFQKRSNNNGHLVEIQAPIVSVEAVRIGRFYESEHDPMEALEPVVEPHEVEYIRNDLKRHLTEHLKSDLEPDERLIVTIHWLAPEPSTLDEIAKALGTSRQAVFLIEQRAFAKLRQGLARRRTK